MTHKTYDSQSTFTIELASDHEIAHIQECEPETINILNWELWLCLGKIRLFRKPTDMELENISWTLTTIPD